MQKIEIPGHPDYFISERGQVFHRETKDFVPLLSGSYTLQSTEGKVRISYDEVMSRIADAQRVAPEKKPKKPKKEKEAKKVANEDGIHEEGNFTLIESVQKCRTRAALEEIVEANNIDVNLDSYGLFRDQKSAVLDYLA